MNNTEQFIESIENINSDPNQVMDFKLGTIAPDYITGKPSVIFDGETLATTKTYMFIASYKPTANDRVLIASVGGSFVVLGKITDVISGGINGPGIFTTLKSDSLEVTNGILASNLTINDGITADYLIATTSTNTQIGYLKVLNRIGFFGTSPASKVSVSDPSFTTITSYTADSTYSSNEVSMLNAAKADIDNLYTKLKAVIDALQSYGLI